MAEQFVDDIRLTFLDGEMQRRVLETEGSGVDIELVSDRKLDDI